MHSPPQLWKVSLACSLKMAEAAGNAFEEDAASVTLLAPPRKNKAEVEALFTGKPDMAALNARMAVLAALHKAKAPTIQVSKVGNLNWLKKVAADFPPITIARWTIYGAAHRDKVVNKRLALQIDATSAFGTGEHPTTRGCLEVLDRVLKTYRKNHPPLEEGSREHRERGEGSTENLRLTPPRNPPDLIRGISTLPQGEGNNRVSRYSSTPTALDLGCGSGILGMAYAKACRGKVVAVDLDPDAVQIASGNVRANRLNAYIKTGVSNGYQAALVKKGAPYGLIMANIFARPLCEMALDLKDHLMPGGIAILSGILNTQTNAVISAHRQQGLHLIHRRRLGEWSVLALRRPLKA